jgi:hypothetical protein
LRKGYKVTPEILSFSPFHIDGISWNVYSPCINRELATLLLMDKSCLVEKVLLTVILLLVIVRPERRRMRGRGRVIAKRNISYPCFGQLHDWYESWQKCSRSRREMGERIQMGFYHEPLA